MANAITDWLDKLLNGPYGRVPAQQISARTAYELRFESKGKAVRFKDAELMKGVQIAIPPSGVRS